MLTFVIISATLKLVGAALLFGYTRATSRRKRLVRWAVRGERP